MLKNIKKGDGKLEDFVYKNIIKLNTPVGYFFVSNGKENIPFSVRKSIFNVPYNIYNDNNQKIIEELNTETNYDLVIDVKSLKLNHYYNIGFSNGIWHFGGSDEHTESIVTTIDNWSVGIGAYNPNEDEEIEQAILYTGKEKGYIQHPQTFDETKFVRYSVSSAFEFSDHFEFKLLDYSYPEIVFNVAWIENGGYDKEIYEDALDFWLT